MNPTSRMPSIVRTVFLVTVLVLGSVPPAFAQYMRITTDNPVDPTRMRESGTTVLTITLDTNHDRNGALQTCNSHSAGCGAPSTGQPLDMFSYTLDLIAVGGTVSWGTFTATDANYTPLGTDISDDTSVEINRARPVGTVTPPGLATLGSIPVTILSGSPRIDVARGAVPVNPAAFGTGFGTSCDGFSFANTYVIGDPADPCGTISGFGPADWFDADGAGAPAAADRPPILNPIANMTVGGCPLGTADQAISAADPDGDAIAFTSSGPSWMTVTSNAQVGNTRTGNIHLAPPVGTGGTFAASVTAASGSPPLTSTRSFTITISATNCPPVLNPIANMIVPEGSTADQTITASDPDGNAIVFSKSAGPTFMTVTTTNAGTGTATGNIHLATGFSDGGVYGATVTASDGSLTASRSFSITVCLGCQRAPVLSQPANMFVLQGFTADQSISATDPDGNALTFAKAAGPSYMTVTTTSAGTGTATGNIHLAPSFTDPQGTFGATVSVTDGSLSDSKSFTITVSHGDFPPVLNQPANMTVNEGATANQTLTATDQDGNAVTFSKVSGPSYVTITTVTAMSGNVHLAPGFVDAGTASVTVRATDGIGLSDQKSFTVTVNDVNRAPVVAQPANMTVNAGATADQVVAATDPDGDIVTFSKVAGPTFVTVTTTSPSTCNVHVAPGFGDTGTFTVTVRAMDNGTPPLSNEKSFTLTVSPVCRPPVLSQPANMTVTAGGTADQTISGFSSDGSPMTFTMVAGPTFMTVMTTSATTGIIHLAPGFSNVGSYSATVRGTVGGICPGSVDKSFTILVCSPGPAPSLAQPANMTVQEGATADQALIATDPDGNPLTFAKTVGPTFMTVTTVSPGTGTATGNVHLAPGFLDRGTYGATVTVSDGGICNGMNSKSFTITVPTPPNRCPTAAPGGPYTGLVGVPVTFDGSASSDPDGDPLTYAWDFDASNGIEADAVGVIASHIYTTFGTFTVTLTVTDNGHGDASQVCQATATTAAVIADACDVLIFNGYDTIRLGAGRPFWFGYVQPETGCYSNTDVVTSSFVMKYASRQISAAPAKTLVGGDKSGDGIQEIKVSFTKDDLRALFTGTGLANGHNAVTVTIEADLVTGGRLSGQTTLDVVNNGTFSAPTVAPNPLNPSAVLTYTTAREGFVRIDLFDIQGRLVRKLVDEPAMAAGIHQTAINGEGLASGVYYVRGISSEGVFKQLITILK